MVTSKLVSVSLFTTLVQRRGGGGGGGDGARPLVPCDRDRRLDDDRFRSFLKRYVERK